MKKVLHITATVMEMALIIGTWVVNYFSNKKMGMMRYVVFKNTRWGQKYPLELLRILTVAAIIVLAVVFLMFIWKRLRQQSAMGKVMAAETVLITAGYAGFNLLASVQTVRAFYFISGMLALACLLQLLRTGLAVKRA